LHGFITGIFLAGAIGSVGMIFTAMVFDGSVVSLNPRSLLPGRCIQCNVNLSTLAERSKNRPTSAAGHLCWDAVFRSPGSGTIRYGLAGLFQWDGGPLPVATGYHRLQFDPHVFLGWIEDIL
jgi:hypothetical protein